MWVIVYIWPNELAPGTIRISSHGKSLPVVHLYYFISSAFLLNLFSRKKFLVSINVVLKKETTKILMWLTNP